MKSFHDVFVKLDEMIMTSAKENSQAWFKKAKISEETISELYTRQIKVSVDPETGEPNGKYPPKFTYKVVKRDGKFQNFKVYDNDKVVFDVDKKTDSPVEFSNVVMKGTRVKAVLKCAGIWVANGKFGCTWRAEQMCVKVPEGGLRDFAILSDSDDEDDTSSVTSGSGEKQLMIEDSSDEEGGGEEDEVKPTPPPEKKKVRKRVKKVKVKGDDE